jgi:hypothetical protein
VETNFDPIAIGEKAVGMVREVRRQREDKYAPNCSQKRRPEK